MSLLGQFVGGILQQKPDLPEFIKTDPGSGQTAAIKNNANSFAAASGLASDVNAFSQEQLLKALRAAIPGYDTIVGKGSDAISSMIAGELPEGVSEAVERRAASSAVASGYAGSEASRKLVARDLGITSYQITQQGLDSAMRWILNARQTAVAPQMDVTSMFLTPAQQIQVEQANNLGEYQAKLQQANVDAAFDWRTILGQSLQTTDAQITQAALSMAGSVAGGMI